MLIDMKNITSRWTAYLIFKIVWKYWKLNYLLKKQKRDFIIVFFIVWKLCIYLRKMTDTPEYNLAYCRRNQLNKHYACMGVEFLFLP